MESRIVQWGAGNIGRAFIGQIFARNGYEVIFIDINASLVDALNRAGKYQVISVSSKGEEEIPVKGVSAIEGTDEAAIVEAVIGADYLSTSVGQGVLPKIAPAMARAIEGRYRRYPKQTLDIIIAENIKGGALVMKRLLRPHLSPDFPIDTYLGFVETSLGKMVPIQSGNDPLRVYAEPFNTLILDRQGFRGPIPQAPEIRAVEPIEAYVAEKLYIHNLGHASAAYLGHHHSPGLQFIWEVMEHSQLQDQVRGAMEEARAALMAEYPGVFSPAEVDHHIEELLHRFANRALGDTIYRVGRDLKRKLHWEDRLMGAILLAEKHALPWASIGRAWLAGIVFRGRDEGGELNPPDEAFRKHLAGLDRRESYAIAAGFLEDGFLQGELSGGTEALLSNLETIAAVPQD